MLDQMKMRIIIWVIYGDGDKEGNISAKMRRISGVPVEILIDVFILMF